MRRTSKNGKAEKMVRETVRAANLAAILIQIKRPFILWGRSGEGKTSFIEQISRDYGYEFHTEPLHISDPVEVGGVLQLDGSKKPPQWAVKLKKAAPKAMLLLDELTCCPRMLQATGLRIVQENRVGYFDISGVSIAATANPDDLAAGEGAGTIPQGMASRLGHLYWELDQADWEDYMRGGKGVCRNLPEVPSDWMSAFQKWSERVIAFLVFKPEMRTLNEAEVIKRVENTNIPAHDRYAFPSRRGWTNAVTALAATDAVYGDSSPYCFEMMKAFVGGECATAFFSWVADDEIPSPRELLNKPHLWKRSFRLDQATQLLTSTARMVKNEKDWSKLEKVVENALTGGHNEAVLAAAPVLADIRTKNKFPKIFKCVSELLALPTRN